MKSIPTILPIYDSVEKQDQTRTGTKMPVLTPRFRLPSLQWNVQSDAPGEIATVELIDPSIANNQLSSSIVNQGTGYETLTTSGTSIISAINSSGAANALLEPAFTIGIDELVTVRFTLTYTSGQLPYFFIFYGSGNSVDYSQAVVGYNEITIKSDQNSTNAKILMYNQNAANFATDSILVNKNIITTFFNTTPYYIQNGGGAGWQNNATGYDTFTASNKNITSAIKTTAAGVASCWNVVSLGSVPTTITSGEVIRIKAVLTLTGTAPKCALQRTDTSANISNVVTLVAGTNYIYLTATSTITGFAIAFYNANGETCNWSAILTEGAKSVMPKLYTALTDDYFQYKGNTLGLLLPRGLWYLKITTLNGYVYYSDRFIVSDIYENILSTVNNLDYDTFTVTGTSVISARNLAGSASSTSNSFTVKKGEVITFIFNMTLNSGDAPLVLMTNDTWTLSSLGQSIIGLNVINITATWDGTSYFRFYNASVSNFSTSEIIMIRQYSSSFIKLDFHDTHDLGEILYQDGFTQTAFLETKLAPPTHEVVEVGEEKNGIFITEKIITKYKYRIIANIGRELYKALLRLPQHDSITITDEVGNIYTPAVGNVQVLPANWIYYDVCRLEIIFNDNTEYVWTSENNNIT